MPWGLPVSWVEGFSEKPLAPSILWIDVQGTGGPCPSTRAQAQWTRPRPCEGPTCWFGAVEAMLTLSFALQGNKMRVAHRSTSRQSLVYSVPICGQLLSICPLSVLMTLSEASVGVAGVDLEHGSKHSLPASHHTGCLQVYHFSAFSSLSQMEKTAVPF